MDLRCQNKKHGVLFPEDGVVEVACNSRFCGAGSGVTVLHRFSSETGELLETRKFRNPTKKGGADASHNGSPAVRSA